MIDQPNKKPSFIQNITEFWKKGTREKVVLIIAAVFLLSCCCVTFSIAANGASTPASPTQDISAISTSAILTAWAPFTQTALALPTNTATPEYTATPTNTPTPLPTPTFTPAPIVLTGSGDMVIDVPKNGDPAIMYARYSSGSNFIVTNYDANNQQIGLLINAIGSYDGKVPLDFLVNEKTTRLEIKASGPWEIQILPLAQVRRATIPGNIQGVGDDVIYLDGANADLINASASGGSNFIVYSYSGNDIDLVFNEIGPYSGTALLPSTTFMITVKAEGNWSLDITTK